MQLDSLPSPDTAGVRVYSRARGAAFNLKVFRDQCREDIAEDMLDRIRNVSGLRVDERLSPAVPCQALTCAWDRTRSELIEP